jgi:hypothetical protein
VEERTLAEVGLVGNEGIVGLSVFLGIEATPFKAIVQVPGEAMRMKADVFKDLVNPDSPLYSLLLRKSWGTRGIVLRQWDAPLRWAIQNVDRMRSPKSRQKFFKLILVHKPFRGMTCRAATCAPDLNENCYSSVMSIFTHR